MSELSPVHYQNHPSGLECIDITRAQVFTIGNAIKYLWRVGQKDDPSVELGKAKVYLGWAIEDGAQVQHNVSTNGFLDWYHRTYMVLERDRLIAHVLMSQFHYVKEQLS